MHQTKKKNSCAWCFSSEQSTLPDPNLPCWQLCWNPFLIFNFLYLCVIFRMNTINEMYKNRSKVGA